MTTKLMLGLILTSAVIGAASNARAELIGDVEFPQGALSFADAVVSYTPHIDTPDPSTLTGESPDLRWRNPNDALGTPNYVPPTTDYGLDQFVSLGNGGELVLQFVNNKLTGSGNANNDLYIFECGAVNEATFVWISQDGTNWLSVGGTMAGGTRGIDIDPYLVTASLPYTTQFSYVKLQDDVNDVPAGPSGPLPYGAIAGADIDAVGAISSVPEPATLVLMAVAGTILVVRRRQARKNVL
ncbi:MAG: PEP-CTERM sorting domain-containing protein [Planctomycetaceae bacterium]|nr:PEP-CTERM sorting domain-containing protein [Planctomycetaceae bacterium]